MLRTGAAERHRRSLAPAARDARLVAAGRSHRLLAVLGDRHRAVPDRRRDRAVHVRQGDLLPEPRACSCSRPRRRCSRPRAAASATRSIGTLIVTADRHRDRRPGGRRDRDVAVGVRAPGVARAGGRVGDRDASPACRASCSRSSACWSSRRASSASSHRRAANGAVDRASRSSIAGHRDGGARAAACRRRRRARRSRSCPTACARPPTRSARRARRRSAACCCPRSGRASPAASCWAWAGSSATRRS